MTPISRRRLAAGVLLLLLVLSGHRPARAAATQLQLQPSTPTVPNGSPFGIRVTIQGARPAAHGGHAETQRGGKVATRHALGDGGKPHALDVPAALLLDHPKIALRAERVEPAREFDQGMGVGLIEEHI